MGITRIDQYDSHGFVKVEGFCLYAAFAPVDDHATYIKIGITTRPLARIFEVHCGSAMPVEMALWTHVGSRSAARSTELRILSLLKAYKTRGEWICMDLKSKDDKERFHGACRVAFGMATGRPLKWRKMTMQEVLETAGIDPLALKQKAWNP